MLTGLFMTLLGMGSEIYQIKVERPKSRRFLLVVGIPSLIAGLSFSVLWVVKELFDVALSLPKLEDFAWLFSRNLVTVYVWVFVVGILSYVVYWIVSERLYKVDGTPVNSSEHRANIRVDHKGGKSFPCLAKLEEVVRISRNGDRQPQKLDELNPDGKFFEWVDKNWYNKISKDYPRVVRIVGTNEWNRYDSDKTHFIFYGATSTELNPNYSYELTVGLYRIRGLKHIKMKSVKGSLKINNKGLFWDATEQSVPLVTGNTSLPSPKP
jgi:hypothetical protein